MMDLLKNSLYLLTVILCVSCTPLKKVNTECQAYAELIKQVWTYNSSTRTYYFNTVEEWWFNNDFLVESCLLGRTKKEIIKMFGAPSKEFIFLEFSYITYCIEKSCLRPSRMPGNRVEIYFDELGRVNRAGTSPPIQMRGQYD